MARKAENISIIGRGRIDGNAPARLTETIPLYLRALARNSLHAAFRYHRQAAEAPGLSLAWVRFPDSSVLAAVAQEAEVTTMVTSDGKSLTEVKLTVGNQAQPFLKVALPAGASIVSADVAGERVKPVQGWAAASPS